MVGRNCGQVNRSTAEERKALGRCFASAGHVDAESRVVSAVSATILARGEHMDIIAQLKAERDKAAQQVNALDTAIKALSGMNSAGRSARGRRTMSAAARARISASQKARWARTRGKVVSIAPKATERHS